MTISALLQAMLALLALLALATLGLRLVRAPLTLRQQVHAWWILLPIACASGLSFPFGPYALAALIIALALRELMTFRRHGKLVYALGALACAGVGSSALFAHLPLPAASARAWYFYLFAVTALNDIAQFIVGSGFGTHKILPRISPNKSWEGLAGGVVVSAGVSALLGMHLTLGDQTLTVTALLALGALLAVLGFLGDCVFSAGKRVFGIKDYSSLIPGHGGILDRVDSLTLTAPALLIGLFVASYR
jgi:phosphatidate cytidylyltransferase